MTNSNRDASLPAMTVVALLTALSLELVRSTGALLEVAFDVSVFAAAGTALSTYLGAAVLGLGLVWVARRADGPTVVLAGVVLLAVARLVVQGLTATPRVAVGLLTSWSDRHRDCLLGAGCRSLASMTSREPCSVTNHRLVPPLARPRVPNWAPNSS